MGKEYVYFVERFDGLVKIGTTKNLIRRMKELRRKYGQMEFLGVIEGGYECEQHVHKLFKEARVEGEWFKRTRTLHTYIREVRQLPEDQDFRAVGICEEEEEQIIKVDRLRLQKVFENRVHPTSDDGRWTYKRLSEEVGMNRNILSDLNRGIRNTINYSDLHNICCALDCHEEHLIMDFL